MLQYATLSAAYRNAIFTSPELHSYRLRIKALQIATHPLGADSCISLYQSYLQLNLFGIHIANTKHINLGRNRDALAEKDSGSF